jgi:hypothetical protein
VLVQDCNNNDPIETIDLDEHNGIQESVSRSTSGGRPGPRKRRSHGGPTRIHVVAIAGQDDPCPSGSPVFIEYASSHATCTRTAKQGLTTCSTYLYQPELSLTTRGRLGNETPLEVGCHRKWALHQQLQQAPTTMKKVLE